MKSRIVKYDGADKYVFINGVAVVHGMRRSTGDPVTITLKEFKEMKEKQDARS